MENKIIYSDLIKKMNFCLEVLSKLDSQRKQEYSKKMQLVQITLKENCKIVNGRIPRETILPMEVIESYEEFKNYHNKNFISFGKLD